MLTELQIAVVASKEHNRSKSFKMIWMMIRKIVSYCYLINEGKNPHELDLFSMETRARKLIHDLVNPLLDRMGQDREKMIVTNTRN